MSIERAELVPAGLALLNGNEAIARGALEGGVRYSSSYPGAPASEILEAMVGHARQHDIYVEWSVNEKVALEGAAAASYAGIRSMCAMKANGLNVVADFLMSLSLAGVRAGLVLVVCDDPAGHSSTNEEDSRFYSLLADIPLFEPSDFQEAKDMVVEALELSEKIGLVCIVRGVTRIAHARGNVRLGPVSLPREKARVDLSKRYITWPTFHPEQRRKMAVARRLVEDFSFNRYEGPRDARVVVVTTGTGVVYSREAIHSLDLGDRVGIIKVGTTWPLPENLILRHLAHAERVLIAEEVEPFLERNVKNLAAQKLDGNLPAFFGKESGHIRGTLGPGIGELDPDVVRRALAAVAGPTVTSPEELEEGGLAGPTGGAGAGVEAPAVSSPIAAPLEVTVPNRELAFCPGCPHRASYWAMRTALQIDGRDGFVVGDIGCLTLGLGPTGYNILQTLHCMGSAMGISTGFGKLDRFGFDQPVIGVIGDSTFFHAGIPGLVNARYTQSNFLCIVMDNEATAMTGFQPHPGTGKNAMGEDAPRVDIARICEALDLPVFVADPYQVEETTQIICRLLRMNGVKVLILRRTCILVTRRQQVPPQYYVDQTVCLGDACGCARFCTRVFGCPANIWDAEAGKARIDEVICNGCGVCADLCPRGAIRKKVRGADDADDAA